MTQTVGLPDLTSSTLQCCLLFRAKQFH